MECFFLHAQQADVAKLLPLLNFDQGVHIPSAKKNQLIIAWGAEKVLSSEAGADIQIFNDLPQVLETKDKKIMRMILELHGLKITQTNENSDYRIQFQIPVFHLKALRVFVKKNTKKLWSPLPYSIANKDPFEEIEINENIGFYVRRAIREARKAVYALGLDYAFVHIGILGRGDTVVIDVDPIPALNQRLAECYADAMNRLAFELKDQTGITRHKPILIGADPEFILRKPNGKVVSADRFMDRAGVVGCDAVVLSGHQVLLPLVELRPEPSTSPIILTQHLRSLMKQAEKMISEPDLDWLAGAMPVKGLPLGGHIHFSGVEVSSRLLRVLDNYLALPLIMLENKSVNRRRPRYGFLGDFRKKSHGGFEYRSLPSWLVSPKVTLGVLSLGFVIAHHYLEFKQQPLRQIEVQRAFYSGDKSVIEPLIEKLWLDIQSTDMYEKYHKELNGLFQMMLHKEVWQEQQDFRKNWIITSSYDHKSHMS
jgi:hypothetical protein